MAQWKFKMATHPQGKGTQNVAVNLLDEEKAALGRLAAADDRSLGDFIRRMTMLGLKMTNPQQAVELELVRKRHREQMNLNFTGGAK